MEENSLALNEKIELTKKEKKALEIYDRVEGHPISPTTQAQFFALYLNGKTCSDIQRLNPGFHLGAIVRARIDGKWDEKLKEYREELLASVSDRAKQTMFESVHFVSDLLTATHKYHGGKLARYIQTGNEEELGELEIKNIGVYQRVLEMLLKLTGQDNNQKVQHTIIDERKDIKDSLPTASQASEILAILEGKKK